MGFGYHQEAYWGEGYNDPSYWALTNGCLVQLTSAAKAEFGCLYFRPLPNQVIEGVAVGNTNRLATAQGNVYTASLVKKAKYQIYSPKFTFADRVITVPDAAVADLADLLVQARRSTS